MVANMPLHISVIPMEAEPIVVKKSGEANAIILLLVKMNGQLKRKMDMVLVCHRLVLSPPQNKGLGLGKSYHSIILIQP
jgi:hypothetical protein